MLKVYSFKYNDRTHYLIPTIHYDKSLINTDIIKFITKLINKVDICAFEADATKIKSKKKTKKQMIKNETLIGNIYNKSDIIKIKQQFYKSYSVDIPISYIEKQSMIMLIFSFMIVGSYNNKDNQDLTLKNIIDAYMQSVSTNKIQIFLDTVKYKKTIMSSTKHKRLQNALISNPPNIVDINTQIKGAKILLEKYENLFENNSTLKIITNITDEMRNELTPRNTEWVKQIISVLDKNPEKSIAICVGSDHIFGIDNKNKKIGKTLPNLLSNIKVVSDVNYGVV
jgi:hypothetical protein